MIVQLKSILTYLFFYLIFFLITIEFTSYLLTVNKLFLVNEIPYFYKSQEQRIKPSMADFWTEQDLWGAWHKSNASSVQEKSCYTTDLKSNSIGARDDEFISDKKNPAIILLGDSFAEGFGVNHRESTATVLERLTNRQVFNFGTAGDFGPVQYWLVYKNLAINYNHDTLIIFFLPKNDFTDNDYDFWKTTKETFYNGKSERFRPYYKQVNNNEYEIIYPTNSTKNSAISLKTGYQHFLADHFWSTNAFRTAKMLYQQQLISNTHLQNSLIKNGLPFSGYFDATPAQQKAALYFIDKIIQDTQAKNIIITSIPTQEDIARISFEFNQKKEYWWKFLNTIPSTASKKVQFIDLADHLPANSNLLFNNCDGHWNANGNEWAATVISKFLQ